jgi:outer membrane cobalamin receptor
MKKNLAIIFIFFSTTLIISAQSRLISVLNCQSKEAVSDLDVELNGQEYRTDNYGQILIRNTQLPYKIVIFQNKGVLLDTTISIMQQSLTLCIDMPNTIQEVEVVARRQVEFNAGYLSVNRAYIESSSYVLGERDALKSLQYLPGISQGQEGNSNFYVRGGGAGENLIILDDVALNLSPHVMGLISNVSTDIVDNIDIYKGGFPAEYGNKTSSTVDIKTINPTTTLDQSKRKNIASFGTISTSLSRIQRSRSGKSGIVISARTSLLSLIKEGYDGFLNIQNDESSGNPDERLNNYFQDFYAKYTLALDNKSQVNASIGRFYDGIGSYQDGRKDDSLETGTELKGAYKNRWLNQFAAIKFTTRFNQKLYMNVSANASSQKFRSSELTLRSTFASKIYNQYDNDINSYKASISFQYYMNNFLKVYTGLTNEVSNFKNQDSTLRLLKLNVLKFSKPTGQTAFYSMIKGDLFDKKLNINSGFRVIKFHESNTPMSFEPRINLSYKVLSTLKLLASYSKITQQNQVLTRESIGIPYQIWLPSSESLQPSTSKQVSVGVSYAHSKIKAQLEVFYKKTDNQVLPALGSTIFVVDPTGVETIKNGIHQSKGIEFIAEVNVTSKLDARFVSTLMKSQLKYKELNNGSFFDAFNDRPLNSNIQVNYKLNNKWTINSVFVFLSGAPITIPIGYFQTLGKSQFRPGEVNFIGGSASRNEFNEINLITSEIYGPWQYYAKEINNYRTNEYHRLDINVVKKTLRKNSERAMSFGLYNAYGRRNPFITYLVNEPNSPVFRLKNYSLFNFLPYFNYQITF